MSMSVSQTKIFKKPLLSNTLRKFIFSALYQSVSSDIKSAIPAIGKRSSLYSHIHFTFIRLVISTCNTKKSTTLTDRTGYLSSYVTRTRGCGSASSPWIISASPGQIVHLELTDFSSSPDNSQIMSCRTVYGFILERALGINQTICGGVARQSPIYASKTNSIEIQFVRNGNRRETEFLIKYDGK